MTQVVFPAVIDDDGSGKTGTPINKAWSDSVKSGIDTLIHSSTNPTLDPKAIIDEVKAARGSKASLDLRLDVSLNEDGTLIVPASIVTLAQLQAQAGSAINLCKNSTFFLWSKGKTLDPDYWVSSNGTVSISGTGETDTTRKIGAKCARLTWTSGLANLSQLIIPAADFASLDFLKSAKVGFGMWVKSSIVNQASIQISDGVTTTAAPHTGGGAFEWLSGVHTMSAAATSLNFALVNGQAGPIYGSGGVVGLMDAAPARWYPERLVRGSMMVELPGTQSVGDGKKYFHFARPVRIDNLQIFFITGPTGASFNIDFEKRKAAAWSSMIGGGGSFVAAGDSVGDFQTSGDYDLRCLSGLHLGAGAAFPAGVDDRLARLNIDQVGSTVAGADAFLRVDGVQCVHPFEDQLSYNFQG